ncbi:MAG: DUF4886 domain-containing protein [Niabella sp.]
MKILYSVLVIIVLLPGVQSHAQKDASHIRLFIIGNSFSQNASRYLKQIAERGDCQLTIGRAELGGCSLQRHWDSVAVNLLDSSRGKAYNGRSLKELLSNDKWDIVTIQQYSLLSGDTATYQPYARKLYAFIKALQPDAEVVIHQTWAYRSDAKNFGKISGNKRAGSQKEMWERSRYAYHKLAGDLGGLRIIPVGDVFYAAATDKEWSFVKDNSFDDENPVPSRLPAEANSLNVGYFWKDGRLWFDPNHANEAGCYLAGLVWYGFLFKQNVQKVSFRPGEVSENFAEFLKNTALQTLRSNQ